MEKQGQVYIKVQASESVVMQMNVIESGEAQTNIVVVKWNLKGITGQYGWPSKMPYVGFDDTEEDINNKLVQGINMAYPNVNDKLRYLLTLDGCTA